MIDKNDIVKQVCFPDSRFRMCLTPHFENMFGRLDGVGMVAVAHTPEGITVFNGVMKTLDRLDEYTYAGFDFPELNHSGWSIVEDMAHVQMLNDMAFASHTKSYYFDPNITYIPDRRFVFKISGRTVGKSTAAMCELHDAMFKLKYPKSVPHYRDLEYRHKKKRI